MNRALAAEYGLRPIIGIVMEKGPASSHFIDKRLDAYSLSRVLVIFSPDGQGNSVPGWHNDTGGPNLDIEFVDFSRGERLLDIMCMIRSVSGADGRIEFTMGCPEPSLGNGGVGVEGALENDLFEVRSENPDNEKEVCVRRRGGDKQF
jgi:hypothetical protein